MITKADIINFFDVEAEATKKSWEATMKLPLSDRIRKRKAIKDVYLDRDYRDITDDHDVLLRVKVGSNLSDFKEGEILLLHKEDSMSGFEVTINSFHGEDTIYLEVFPPKMPSELDSYYDKPLVLDKNLVDLRNSVYSHFMYYLPNKNEDFWNTVLFNSKPIPTFENKKEHEEEVVDSEHYFGLELLQNQREAIVNSMSANDYYLIQGPPGTGKSFVLGFLIIEETTFFKHKVIIIGPNHMAINNTLLQVYKFGVKIDFFPKSNIMKFGQLYNHPNIKDEEGNYVIKHFSRLNSNGINKINTFNGIWVIGLTPHSLYTSRATGLKCDTLIIDEAGQMTIPLALMGMIKAKKVILAGDHKQLPPIISSDDLPEYMQKSAFETLMTEGNYTLLDTSFRMCEPLCEFVSDIFYAGKIKAYKKGCGDLVNNSDPLYGFDKPVVIHQVDDTGMQASDKEAQFIIETIAEFLKKGVPSDEIAVLSPFRAQAATVRRGIRKREDISDEDKKNLVADTVDKMQGQEREVIIYSFTAGDPDYMTEMADFLYNPNKLNVAFSRAKSKLIIVGNIDKIKEIAGGEYPHIISMLSHKNVTMV